ncbi:hypothetical protein UFOVP328_320 [uncultured Caudovirales phage]|uniref:Uncharacterized protein n=1 Tax=uncultured Caudovirales phage TaxID=2100421 RepID=A0A6J5LYI0_9CAUD|nr:hypothetical protein UFOVP328_320 [uncultured Caudovirales phage]
MTPIKILGICGAGGLRMDFIAGWLGKLPKFVKSQWYIDPITRQSCSITSNVVLLDRDFDLKSVLEQSYNYKLDPHADVYYATKLHVLNQQHQHLVENKSIKIYNLVTDAGVDMSQVKWEFFIKTYGGISYEQWHIDTLINQPTITDQDRVDQLNHLLKNKHIVYRYPNNPKDCPLLEYSKLFVPGGSRYLCDVVGISADSDYHDFWDSMLPLAKTPPEVTLWGQRWRKQDYFN